jgi:prevent-host-death family protein
MTSPGWQKSREVCRVPDHVTCAERLGHQRASAISHPSETQPVQEWQADNARAAFAEIIEAAVEGTPQLIRRRDGKEVVVVSRDYFEAHKPNLRDYLLTSGYAEEHDEFDDAPITVRKAGAALFARRAETLED